MIADIWYYIDLEVLSKCYSSNNANMLLKAWYYIVTVKILLLMVPIYVNLAFHLTVIENQDKSFLMEAKIIVRT